jgi:hypothetical protein
VVVRWHAIFEQKICCMDGRVGSGSGLGGCIGHWLIGVTAGDGWWGIGEEGSTTWVDAQIGVIGRANAWCAGSAFNRYPVIKVIRRRRK